MIRTANSENAVVVEMIESGDQPGGIGLASRVDR
jgi:hypothetical protein